jgi:hypothetical protein
LKLLKGKGLERVCAISLIQFACLEKAGLTGAPLVQRLVWLILSAQVHLRVFGSQLQLGRWENSVARFESSLLLLCRAYASTLAATQQQRLLAGGMLQHVSEAAGDSLLCLVADGAVCSLRQLLDKLGYELQSTRLVTRTKETIVHASAKVENLCA